MKSLANVVEKCVCYLIVVWLVVVGWTETTFSAKHERGLTLENASVQDQQGNEVVLYQESYALVIGISEYTNGWPNLPGVKKDVEEVRDALALHGFRVEVKMDLTNIELDQAFDDFIGRYGHDPDNRLLFYFAGHGHTIRTTYGEELGYIIPTDAPNPNQDLPGFQSTAMEMQQIEIYAKRIQAKHALFLFDACFSGSLFALSRAVPQIISYKTSQPVRQFITSGSADEAVPDESIFRAQFARALQGEADTDNDGYVTGTELGEFLQKTVVNYSYNAQHPQYGKIRNPNLDKGDFVFIIPLDKQEEEVSSTSVEEPPEVTFSFEDLEVQVKWQKYLATMEDAFSKVIQYEKGTDGADANIAAWQHFLNSFPDDNPYSTRDEELRNAAQKRVQQWKSGTIPAQPPISQPGISSSPEPVFRIKTLVVKDAKGKVIEPEDEVYSLKVDTTVTLTVDVEYPPDHSIKATWTARNGKVFPTAELINIYRAQKPGPDMVIIYLLDETTGDEIEESIMLTVVP